MARVIRYAPLVLVAGVIVVLAVAFRYDPHDVRSAAVGKPAPAFSLEALEGGGRIDLASYRGKVVVVNFFASWCVPCRQEHAALANAWTRYGGSGVVLIGVLYQDDPSSGREFMRRLGGGWPTAIDEDGRVALSFGVFGIPETFFIGPDGIIAGRHIGPIDEATLATGIDALRRASLSPP
ncbi:MAG: redoxin domain-containing protein [Chloroflexi bacterium]|nr:redoxin domain-containing protein [Chloroflexota bacterium]